MKCNCIVYVYGTRYEHQGRGNCNTCDLVAVKYEPLTQAGGK